jgi:hypothetical protein
MILVFTRKLFQLKAIHLTKDLEIRPTELETKRLGKRFGAAHAARKALIQYEIVCSGSSRCASLKYLDDPKQTAIPSMRYAQI